MVKKPKARIPETVVDEDGYESDGMYRWGGPKTSFSYEMMKQWVDDSNKSFNRTAVDRIAELREFLTEIISPHVDGPLSVEACRAIFGRNITRLNLSTGDGLFAFHKGVAHRGFLDDATNALHELDSLGKLIATKPFRIDQIVRASMFAGILVERAQLRACFGPEVISAKKRRKASAKGGKASAKWNPKIAALAGSILADMKRSKLSKAAAFRRTASKLKSEHNIAISAKTLERRLTAGEADNS